jgi:hypothetical protein
MNLRSWIVLCLVLAAAIVGAILLWLGPDTCQELRVPPGWLRKTPPPAPPTRSA